MRVMFFAVAAIALSGCGKSTEKPGDSIVIIDNNDTTGAPNNTNNGTTSSMTNGSNGTTGTVLAVGEFLQQARAAYCEAAFSCPNAANIFLVRNTARFGDVDRCMRSNEVLYAELNDIEGGVASGAIAYDGTRAAECIADLQQSLCDGSWGRVTGGIPSCADVLRGQRSEGERCVGSYDCAAGAYCATFEACDARTCVRSGTDCGGARCDAQTEYCDASTTTCRPRKSEGAPCDFAQCQGFLVCSERTGGQCIPWGSRAAGETCLLDQSCATGLICNVDRGVCESVVFGSTGAACGWRDGRACEPGLACQIEEGADVGTCGTALPRGASCRLDSACADNQICDVWNENTCQPPFPAGATCQSPFQCASRSCPGGMGSAQDGVCAAECSR